MHGQWRGVDNEPSPYILKVDVAYDEDGHDVAEALARRVAETLNGDRYEIEIDASRIVPFLNRITISDRRTGAFVGHRRMFGYGRAALWATDAVDRLIAEGI